VSLARLRELTRRAGRALAVIASSAMDSNIRIWDAESGNLVRTINAFPGACARSLFAPLPCVPTNAVCVLHRRGCLLGVRAVETWAIAFSPDGRLIASSSKSGNINLWSVETGEKAQTLEPTGKFTMCVAFVRHSPTRTHLPPPQRRLLTLCGGACPVVSAESQRQVRGVRCGGRSGDRFRGEGRQASPFH
jgi:WD40 repeat protein